MFAPKVYKTSDCGSLSNQDTSRASNRIPRTFMKTPSISFRKITIARLALLINLWTVLNSRKTAPEDGSINESDESGVINIG